MNTARARPWILLSPARASRLWIPAIIAVYIAMAVGVWAGWWAVGWGEIVGGMWEPPSARHWLGTNLLGQDILTRAVAGTATAFEIGLVVALVSTALGSLIGVTAGYHEGSWIDSSLVWLAGTIDAIPFYLFVAALAFAMHGHPAAMQLAMIATFWTTTARLVRAETQRIRRLDFIEAARACGTPPSRIMLRHVLPNLSHLILVQATLVFVAAIKVEVVLSFLGLGVQDSISWGVMIAEAGQEILAGQYMNFIAASVFLFGLVMSFNGLADRLQEYLDPRLRRLHSRRIE